MASKKVAIKKHPNLDWAVAFMGGPAIPTKQDKFKPLIGYQGIMQDDGAETIFDELYIKNPAKQSIQDFEAKLREYIKENLKAEHPYPMPSQVEVILAFNVNAKRFFQVDVDNLSKNILDCMKGLVFEDDSQVVNLLAMKNIHPFEINGLMIGVNQVDDSEKSWFDKIRLFYIDELQDE